MSLIIRFISEQGKILSRRVTRLTLKQQRLITIAIKRARILSSLPFLNNKLNKKKNKKLNIKNNKKQFEKRGNKKQFEKRGNKKQFEKRGLVARTAGPRTEKK